MVNQNEIMFQNMEVFLYKLAIGLEKFMMEFGNKKW